MMGMLLIPAILAVGGLAFRCRDLQKKADKFDAYCLQVRAGISSDISSFQDKPARAEAIERFMFRIDDVELCAGISPTRFQRCDEHCAESLMLEARQHIAVPN